MDFIQHTNNWIKGEIFEATIFGSFGLLTIFFSLLFWKFGGTPNSKTVIIPLAIVGFFFLVTAFSGIASNNKRLIQYSDAFQKNKPEFVKSEKMRVENFQNMYRATFIIASVCFFVASCFFLFTNNQTLRGIGIALVFFGLNGLIIDYFSKERADIYYKAIMTEIESHYS
jgi:hypothetical protein